MIKYLLLSIIEPISRGKNGLEYKKKNRINAKK